MERLCRKCREPIRTFVSASTAIAPAKTSSASVATCRSRFRLRSRKFSFFAAPCALYLCIEPRRPLGSLIVSNLYRGSRSTATSKLPKDLSYV
jgi:hypothetical protein